MIGFVAFLALGATLTPSQAGGVSIQWKLKKNDIFYVQTVGKSEQTIKMNGETQPQKQDDTSVYQYEVMKAAKDGYVLEQTILAMSSKSNPDRTGGVDQFAKVVGSTSRLLQEVEKNPVKKFIVATETGIFHQMKKLRPDVELIQAPVEDKTCACNNCPYMKLNTIEKIKHALQTLSPQVTLDEDLRARAQVSLDRMMSLSRGEKVTWPERFNL